MKFPTESSRIDRSNQIVMIPGVSFVAKMFSPLVTKLNPPLSAYGINWPFHKSLPVAYQPRPEVKDRGAFLKKFITAEELARYVLFALSLLNRSPNKPESMASGLCTVETLSEDAESQVALPIGFGHSAGATALLVCEALYPGTFSALFLYEPVFITDFTAAPQEVREEIAFLQERTTDRRSVFSSREEAKDHFLNRMPFAAMDQTCLDFYIKDSLCPNGTSNRELELILDGPTEAKFYDYFAKIVGLSTLAEPVCPVHVLIGSETGKVASYSLYNLEYLIKNVSTTTLGGLDHFGPFTAPATVANVINDLSPL